MNPLVFFYRVAGFMLTLHLVVIGMLFKKYLNGIAIDPMMFFRICTMTLMPLPIVFLKEVSWLNWRFGRWTFPTIYLAVAWWLPDLWVVEKPIFKNVQLWVTVGIIANLFLLLFVTWRITREQTQSRRRV